MTTRRWPVVVFCNMVDVAAINAYTLWIANNPYYLDDNSKTGSPRRQFLIDLGMALVKPYIERRAEKPTGLSHHVRKAIGQVLGRRIVDIVPENIAPNQSRIRCKLCVNEACDTPGYKDKKYKANKSNYECCSCNTRICGRHCKKEIKYVCNDCEDPCPKIRTMQKKKLFELRNKDKLSMYSGFNKYVHIWIQVSSSVVS